MLAKRYATLDVLSQGRVIAGLSLGWSKDEYQASNIPYPNRGERADEFLQVMKKVWTDDIVENITISRPQRLSLNLFKNLFQYILEGSLLIHFQE
jgi:alkanesulfonate monooxygenase SsuD/methylene tetrahydromethanopterin reductase-like flavin-dependent oxidoreductase (luciferase family)